MASVAEVKATIEAARTNVLNSAAASGAVTEGLDVIRQNEDNAKLGDIVAACTAIGENALQLPFGAVSTAVGETRGVYASALDGTEDTRVAEMYTGLDGAVKELEGSGVQARAFAEVVQGVGATVAGLMKNHENDVLPELGQIAEQQENVRGQSTMAIEAMDTYQGTL